MPAEYYYDTNKTIYSYHSVKELGVAAGSSANITLGLDDLTDLSGQSTIIINRIHFAVTSFVDSTVLPNTICSALCLGGIAPAGYITASGAISNLGNVSDYQELEGWPLKGVQKYVVSKQPAGPDQNSLQRSSFSKIWTPSKKNSLALNRGQEIVFNVRTVYGELDSYLSIFIEARRGV